MQSLTGSVDSVTATSMYQHWRVSGTQDTACVTLSWQQGSTQGFRALAQIFTHPWLLSQASPEEISPHRKRLVLTRRNWLAISHVVPQIRGQWLGKPSSHQLTLSCCMVTSPHPALVFSGTASESPVHTTAEVWAVGGKVRWWEEEREEEKNWRTT